MEQLARLLATRAAGVGFERIATSAERVRESCGVRSPGALASALRDLPTAASQEAAEHADVTE